MREDEQRAGVGRHRARDVEEEHEPAAAKPALAPGALERLTAGPEASGGSSAGGRERPIASVWRRRERRVGTASLTRCHQLGEQRELLRRAAGEALLLQDLDRAREQELRLDLLGPSRPRRVSDPDVVTLGSGRSISTGAGLLAEEGAEDPVVDRDVVSPRDEGAAARPVEIARAGRATPRGRSR